MRMEKWGALAACYSGFFSPTCCIPARHQQSLSPSIIPSVSTLQVPEFNHLQVLTISTLLGDLAVTLCSRFWVYSAYTHRQAWTQNPLLSHSTPVSRLTNTLHELTWIHKTLCVFFISIEKAPPPKNPFLLTSNSVSVWTSGKKTYRGIFVLQHCLYICVYEA